MSTVGGFERGLLQCPSCGQRYPAEERFCPVCHLPLVFAAEAPGDEASERYQPVSERHEPERQGPVSERHEPAYERHEPASERQAPVSERHERVSERHERARKMKPQLAEGDLVRIAGARNQPEAEFIQGLLLEEGVPSLTRRSAGFDVPDFLAAGPRDVLVPQSGFATAREVLLQAELIAPEPSRPTVAPARLLIGLLVALAIGTLIAWLVLSVHS